MSQRLSVIFVLAATVAFGQTSSGVISGRVLDPSGSAVANASVTLTNVRTGAIWPGVTDNGGEFVFTALQPGTYNLVVKAAGFKNVEKTGMQLSASERLSAGTLITEIGTTSE